mmetsp:Transcript_19025/g.38454  ORF Transcript_19025/g.38454 Transcript_19025/m.38454 type:complete len:196 (-) Transcript_19025:170-757(-)
MGEATSKILGRIHTSLTSTPPKHILILGLSSVGKETMLKKLFPSKEVKESIPTIGMAMKTVEDDNGFKYTACNLGWGSIRALFRHYYKTAAGIIFVVDAEDKQRLDLARDTLHDMATDLDEVKKQGIPILVMANKQDLSGAASTSELVEALKLNKLAKFEWHIQAASAIDRENDSAFGVHEGFAWIRSAIRKQTP